MAIPSSAGNTANSMRVGFLLLPEFSLLGVTSGIDVMRHANRLSGDRYFHWTVISADGAPVRATNGLLLSPDTSIHDAQDLSLLFVCGGFNPERYQNATVFTWLRALARNGAAMGGITTGSYILARAGLLDGYACTIHWENAVTMANDFPRVEVRNTLYLIDRNRYTSSGATASLDLFLQLVVRRAGHDLAVAVAEQLQMGRIRNGIDEQALLHRMVAGFRSEKLAAAIAIMEANIEPPVPLMELAERVFLTRRQVQRLFRKHTGTSPSDYYMRLRLRRARMLVTQTTSRILDIAVATGFGTQSHFTKCYRERYGVTPVADRNNMT